MKVKEELNKLSNLFNNGYYDDVINKCKNIIRKNPSESFFYNFVGLAYKEKNNIIEVTVDFVSEIISCVRNKNKEIISGDPNKIKKVHDTWKFSRDLRSSNPNWYLVETQV